MSEEMIIQSHTGPYHVHFVKDALKHACALVSDSVHFIVDKRVAELYRDQMPEIINTSSVLLIDATESAKSLERMPDYVRHLVANGVRRGHRLVAIGGGITQDITCFLSATMMRGMAWLFFPTTLLSQADSCIGSKSSINVGEMKNILGTFTPPREVFIDVSFQRTLDEHDVRSGVGEMLKVHAIEGADSFARIAADYERLFNDHAIMAKYVRRSLEIKKPFVEEDEFDLGPRQIFNYGHSFGHAIESATNFGVPHGIAVTMGMDYANFLAWKIGSSGRDVFDRMHPTLRRNFQGFERVAVSPEKFFAALSRDKKNTNSDFVMVILPNFQGQVEKIAIPLNQDMRASFDAYIATARAA